MFNFNRKARTLYISHIPQEKIFADSLKADLKMIGYSVITTPYNKTERQIKQVCPKIVESVDAVIVLKSPSSARSQRVWEDIATARMYNVPVIPMVVHHFEDHIPVHAHIHAVDDFDLGVARLRDALDRKHHYAHNELNYNHMKTLMRKTVVAAAIMVLTIIAALVP